MIMKKQHLRLFSFLTGLCLLFAVQTVSFAQDSDAPLYSWTFDEGGSPYTLQGGASLTDGRAGKAASLNGSSQYVQLPSEITNDITGDFSINVWVNPSSTDVWTRVFDIGTGESAYAFLTCSAGSTPRFAITKSGGNSSETVVNASAPITPNTWTNIIVVKSGDTLSLYINGQLNDTAALTYSLNALGATDKNYIGKSQYSADKYFKGMVDDLQLYGYALSKEQINQLADINGQLIEQYNRLVIDTKFLDNTAVSSDESGTDTKNLALNIPSYRAQDALVLVASYRADGVLDKVKAKDTTLSIGLTPVTLEDVRTPDTHTLKEFIWYADGSLSPISSHEGEPLYQFADGIQVTVSTQLKNYRDALCKATVICTPFDSDDKMLTGQLMSDTVFLEPGEEATIDLALSCSADAEYYLVEVEDYLIFPDGTMIAYSYTAGYLPRASVQFPNASPEDTASTTFGAHDPSIFKDPQSGKYYAYSTQANMTGYPYVMDAFESDDLIHWKRLDMSAFQIPDSMRSFFQQNYSNTTMNSGVWAPDIFYAEEDSETPYWLYYSVSTGLGGRNSAMGLLKCSSPRITDGKIVDAGVVLASTNASATNAIDSNIYVDTDGTRYFLWGSFWKGIHGAKLAADGRVEGVDYSSGAAILTTSDKVGARLFSTPSGVNGPEGPYMITNEKTGYRYLFTSYGWLGTNYNIRVARTPVSKSMSDILAKESHRQFVDQKDRQVGKSYSEQADKTELWGYKMIGSYQLDGLTYYGNGHNSILHDGDNWYLVEHARKQPEGFANLQVRKILWTEDGWPIVSPMVYAGETEQPIPEKMLYGTWSLSSVGHSINAGTVTDVGNSSSAKNTDLPVLSSDIILKPRGTLADDLGTWTFDGDHKVTITFKKDGDPDKNQYFKSGDVYTMYALASYDKDKREHCLVLTGTDQTETAQWAKKTGNSVNDIGR